MNLLTLNNIIGGTPRMIYNHMINFAVPFVSKKMKVKITLIYFFIKKCII